MSKVFVANINMFSFIVCILSILLCSCNDDDSIVIPEGELSIKKFSNRLETVLSDSEIKSFNIETKELNFNKLTIADIKHRINNLDTLLFYIGDEMMFSSISIVATSSDGIFNYLSFIMDDSKCYLADGYPSLNTLGENEEKYKKQREANAQKIKKEWDIFIEYLRQRGKILK